VATEHDDAICAGIGAADRTQLFGLLERLAKGLGLQPGIHPGYRTLGEVEAKVAPPRSNPEGDVEN
jgi:hypothetical protein